MKTKDIFAFSIIRVDYQNLLWGLFICFLLPPIISIPIALYKFLSEKNTNEWNCFILFAAFASYMAVINAGKFPEGDQSNYWAVYMNVPKNGFWWAINHIYGFRDATNGKEFMNGIYNYIGYYLTAGNYGMYIWLNTIVIYMPFYYSIMKMFENKPNAKYLILTGVLCLSFFSQFFNLTIHLQRQTIAYSLVIILYCLKAVTGKNNIIIFMIAIFTHTTVLFFTPFIFMDLFYRRMTIRRLFIIGGLILFVLYIMGIITGLSTVSEEESNALSYSLSRMQNTTASDGMKLNKSMYLLFNVPLLFITVLNITKKGLSRLEYLIYNTYIILFFFVLSMQGRELIQYRYSFFTYGYIGMILPAFCAKFKENIQKIYLTVISAFFVIRFYWTFDKMIWTYDSIWKSLFIPEFFNTLFVWYGDISRYL